MGAQPAGPPAGATSRSAPTPTTSTSASCRDDERDATYPKVIAMAPVFAEYQAKTTRVIPLFELTRA